MICKMKNMTMTKLIMMTMIMMRKMKRWTESCPLSESL